MQNLECGTEASGPVALLYFNAGGGHRAAAHALKAELSNRCPEWEVHLVDLFEVLDPDQRFKRLTGFAPEAYYNKRLSTGFTLGLKQELKVLQAMIRVAHPQMVRRLVRYWRDTAPRMVVSLVPNFNRALGASLTRYRSSVTGIDEAGAAANDSGKRQIPFVTVMTDLADYPPNFWVAPGYTEHLVCGTNHAHAQAIAQGVQQRYIHQVSGMVLSPRFYQQQANVDHTNEAAQREEQRLLLGLKPDQPVGCVMFGGHGSAAMRRIATMLSDRPLILLCGRNQALERSLKKLARQAPTIVMGFTEDVAHWMRLADYFIGKPGPGSISEAIHCGLPVIVTRNVWTMPQERFNTDWIHEHGLGQVVSSTVHIPQAVDHLTSDLAAYQQAVGQCQNRALFEVVDVLSSLMHPSVAPVAPTESALTVA